MKVSLIMNPAQRILRNKGLLADGKVQAFHTQNALRRIVKYMPYRTGTLIKLAIAQTDISKPRIVTEAPQAKYLYYGKVMVGRAPKTVTNRDLSYTKTKNPQAGAFWDRALSANEGAAMSADLQRYINSRR